MRRWIAEGKLPARTYGRQLRVARAELAQFGEPPAAATVQPVLIDIASASFGEEWDNPLDAAYDEWRDHYGLSER